MKKFLLLLFAVSFLYTTKAQNTPTAKPDTNSISIDGPSTGSPDDFKATDAYDNNFDQKNTRFNFPGFVIKVHDFNVFNEENGVGHYSYNGDTTQVIFIDTGSVTTIRPKKDSIEVYDDPTRNLENSVIEIIPKHKADSFRLYYTYQMHLLELVAEKSYDIDDTVPESSFSGKSVPWKGMSNYKLMAPRAKNFYHIPKHSLTDYQNPGGWLYEEIKGRFHLKEKTLIDKIAHQKIYSLLYKNKPCVIWLDGINFRVEKYVNGKYKSTNYLLIDYGDYE